MIRNFRHRGLKAFFDRGTTRYLNADFIPKIRRILTALAAASEPGDMDLPGFDGHPLRGDYKNFYAVSVSGNWRIIFRFDNENAADVELLDYH